MVAHNHSPWLSWPTSHCGNTTDPLLQIVIHSLSIPFPLLHVLRPLYYKPLDPRESLSLSLTHRLSKTHNGIVYCSQKGSPSQPSCPSYSTQFTPFLWLPLCLAPSTPTPTPTMTTTPTLSVALASPQVVVISVLDLVNNDLFFMGVTI